MCLEVRDNCGNWFSSSTMTLGIRVRLLDWQQASSSSEPSHQPQWSLSSFGALWLVNFILHFSVLSC